MKTKFFLFGIIFLLCKKISFAIPVIEPSDPSRIYIGPIFGFQKNFYSAGIFNPHDQPESGHFHESYEGSTSNGYYVGFSGEYFLGDMRTTKSSVIGKIFFQKNYSAQLPGEKEGAILNDSSQIEVPTQFFADIDYSAVTLQMFYKLNVWRRFFVAAGTGISYTIYSRINKRQSIIDNPDSTFHLKPYELKRGWMLSNDGRSIIYPHTELNPLLVHANISLGCEIPVRKFLFVPNANFSYGINPLGKFDEHLRVSSLQLGLDIRYIF